MWLPTNHNVEIALCKTAMRFWLYTVHILTSNATIALCHFVLFILGTLLVLD